MHLSIYVIDKNGAIVVSTKQPVEAYAEETVGMVVGEIALTKNTGRVLGQALDASMKMAGDDLRQNHFK